MDTLLTNCRFIIIILSLISQVSCEGVFELELQHFTNPGGLSAAGTCCSGVLDHAQHCTAPCRTFFRVCLKHYQATVTPDPPCTFGSLTTPHLGDNSFTVTDTPQFSNPMRLEFDFSWPGTFSLIIEAYHDSTLSGPSTNSPRELISRLATQRSGDVGSTWTRDSYTHAHSTLTYAYRIVCAPGYYGQHCEVTCSPRNDQFGHYECDANGGKVCMEGWQGEYCDQAICPSGCHPEHGYCDSPNECKCELGYQGVNCDVCIEYPGCVHGYCQVKFECICEPGWAGQYCNLDKEMCANQQPCQHGGTCRNGEPGSYTCECPPGWNGTNCEIRAKSCAFQPCLNGGTCTDEGAGYECACVEGFRGLHCESSALSCQDNPCMHGGTCVSTYDGASFRCECAREYSGDTCEEEVNACDDNPCAHGRCVDEQTGFRCLCETGWTGERCDVNEDNCTPQPCLHGGTCHDQTNNFYCACAPGYTGALCQHNINDCSPQPCRNAGTCHDLVDDYLCSCIPGFGGKDCGINIQECLAEPCQHGGTCVDGINTFTCLCPAGTHGRTCQLLDNETTPPRDSSTHAPPHNTSGGTAVGQALDEPVDNGAVSSQIVLFICVGLAVPLVVIITVLLILLWRRRRVTSHAQAHNACKDNVRNTQLANSMNNSSHSNKLPPESEPVAPSRNRGTHLTHTNEASGPSSSSNSRTIKDINLRNNLHSDSSSSSKLYNKDLNVVGTHCSAMGRSKDYLDTCPSTSHVLDTCPSTSHVLDPKQLHVRHASPPQLSEPGYSKGCEASLGSTVATATPAAQSDIYFLDCAARREAVLATEV